MENVLLINGPNLNLLGQRQTEIYGTMTLSEIEKNLYRIFEAARIELISFQSNHEGDIVDFIQQNKKASFSIINAGALTHTSIAISDAFAGIGVPYVEIHISNIYAREEFRRHSYLSAQATGVIVGMGTEGYAYAANFILCKLKK